MRNYLPRAKALGNKSIRLKFNNEVYTPAHVDIPAVYILVSNNVLAIVHLYVVHHTESVH